MTMSKREPKKSRILERKEKNTLAVILSAVILVAISAVAYAYFTAIITSTSDNEVTVTAKSMKLTFDDGTSEIGNINSILDFGGSVTKKFTIENTGDMDTYARIMWKNLVNTYIYRDLKYTLSYATTENGTYTNLTYNENLPTTSNTPENKVLKGGIYIPVGAKYYFKLVIQLMPSSQ